MPAARNGNCCGSGTENRPKGEIPMRCPVCGVEMRVETKKSAILFFCRSRQCPNYKKQVAQKPLPPPQG